jgi:hypothetical protein
VLTNALPGLPAFQVASTVLGEDIFTARAGVEVRVGGGVSVFVGGGGRWRDNQKSLQANGGLRVVF